MIDTSLISQIQRNIINPDSNLQSILLKTKVLAHHLNNEDLKKWVQSELDGYSNKYEVPDYRVFTNVLIRGEFSNGVYQHSNRDIGITTIPQDIREGLENICILQGVIELEEMAKEKELMSPLPYEWVQLYNIHNADSLSVGKYQLIKAYRLIQGIWITQIIGTIRSRLQDFILKIDDLNWNIDREASPSEQVDKIFQFTIYNDRGTVSMQNLDRNGDTYNVGQAGAVGKYARSDGNSFIQSERQQSLAEVAKEIQQLLQQLEQANPNATEPEKVDYVNDETSLSFKRRAVAALRAGSETAIDEFIFESKSAKVVKSIIKGWLNPD